MSFGPKQNTQEINNFKKINTVSMPQPDNETSLKIINDKPKNLEDSKNKKVFFKDQNTIISVENWKTLNTKKKNCHCQIF